MVFLVGFVNLTAQQSQELSSVFRSNRNGLNVSDELSEAYIHSNEELIYEDCLLFARSEFEADRYLAFRIISDISLKTANQRLKNNIVYCLVNLGLNDISLGVRSGVIDYLNRLDNYSFDQRSQNRLASIIIDKPSHYKRLVKLTGRIQMHQLVPHYTNRLKQDTVINTQQQWAIKLALGRMGDAQFVSECIQYVDAIGINDMVIYNLIPDLLYLQNKQVLDYLLDEVVMVNMDCRSTDPDNEVAIDCGYRLIEVVAPYIKDFPLEVGISGDIKSNNYKEALRVARLWIKKNRANYVPYFEQ